LQLEICKIPGRPLWRYDGFSWDTGGDIARRLLPNLTDESQQHYFANFLKLLLLLLANNWRVLFNNDSKSGLRVIVTGVRIPLSPGL